MTQNMDQNARARVSEVTVLGNISGFHQEIVAGSHRISADEPASAGGTDEGLSPYELLIAALGACTSMTIGLVARRNAWPLNSVIVRLRHKKVNLENASMVDLIEREIELNGSLNSEQRARLLEIANKCPVHKTLTSQIKVHTQLVD